jgi:hypothetical protein
MVEGTRNTWTPRRDSRAESGIISSQTHEHLPSGISCVTHFQIALEKSPKSSFNLSRASSAVSIGKIGMHERHQGVGPIVFSEGSSRGAIQTR